MWCHFHQPQSQPQPHPNFAVFHPCRSSFLFVISTNSSPLSYPSFQLQTQSLFPCLSCLLFPPPVPRRKTTLVTHTWAGKQIYTVHPPPSSDLFKTAFSQSWHHVKPRYPTLNQPQGPQNQLSANQCAQRDALVKSESTRLH
jgi:hypothetical protein